MVHPKTNHALRRFNQKLLRDGSTLSGRSPFSGVSPKTQVHPRTHHYSPEIQPKTSRRWCPPLRGSTKTLHLSGGTQLFLSGGYLENPTLSQMVFLKTHRSPEVQPKTSSEIPSLSLSLSFVSLVRPDSLWMRLKTNLLVPNIEHCIS